MKNLNINIPLSKIKFPKFNFKLENLNPFHSLNDRVKDIEEKMEGAEDYSEQISNLEDSIEQLERNDFDSLERNVEDHEERIDDIETKLSNLDFSELDEFKREYTEQQKLIARLLQKFPDLAEELPNMNMDVQGIPETSI